MTVSLKNAKSGNQRLYIDGEYFLTAPREEIFSCGLYDGLELNSSSFREALRSLYTERIYLQAVSLLSRREHSSFELKRKLYMKFIKSGKDAAEHSLFDGAELRSMIDEVTERLSDNQYLDDSRFARLYAQELIRVRKLAVPAVKEALLHRGIDLKTAEKACVFDDYDPVALIKELLKSRYSDRDLFDEAVQNKLTRSLLRKGYTVSEIRQALYEFLEDYKAPY